MSIFKRLAALQRERKLVESSIVGDDVKARLLAELEAEERALGASPSKADTGAVQAPSGASSARSTK